MPAKFGHEKKDGTIEPVNGEEVDGKFVFTVGGFSNFVALVEKNTPKEEVKVDKSQLKLASDNFKATTDSDKYEYASLDAKEAYNKAINKARQLLEDEHATQEEVNKAVEELNVAISKLTGVKPQEAKGEPEKADAPKEYTGVQAGAIVEPEKVEAPKEYTGKVEQPKAEVPSVDKKELAAEVEKNGDLTSQDSFKEADEEVKKEYREALKTAILVLSNANAKQDEVNNAVETLKKVSEKVNKEKSKLSTLLGDVFKKDKDKDKVSVGLADVAKNQGMVANNSQVNLGTVGKSNSLLAKTGTLALPTTFVGLALICLVYVLRRKNTK